MYRDGKSTFYGLVEHISYKGMFYIQTPIYRSTDYYNLTRAHDHAIRLWRMDNEYS